MFVCYVEDVPVNAEDLFRGRRKPDMFRYRKENEIGKKLAFFVFCFL